MLKFFNLLIGQDLNPQSLLNNFIQRPPGSKLYSGVQDQLKGDQIFKWGLFLSKFFFRFFFGCKNQRRCRQSKIKILDLTFLHLIADTSVLSHQNKLRISFELTTAKKLVSTKCQSYWINTKACFKTWDSVGIARIRTLWQTTLAMTHKSN